MVNEIRVTPEELYFLGSMMNAKYIDYAYIAALDNISENYDLKEKEALTSAAKKGILEEDFSGITIKQEVAQLLKPVFFGESELVVDLYDENSGYAEMVISRFHFLDANVTKVIEENNTFSISTIADSNVWEYVESLLKNRDGNPTEQRISVDETFKPERMITLKIAVIGKEPLSLYFAVVDGYIYSSVGEYEVAFVSDKDLDELINVFKEA